MQMSGITIERKQRERGREGGEEGRERKRGRTCTTTYTHSLILTRLLLPLLNNTSDTLHSNTESNNKGKCRKGTNIMNRCNDTSFKNGKIRIKSKALIDNTCTCMCVRIHVQLQVRACVRVCVRA